MSLAPARIVRAPNGSGLAVEWRPRDDGGPARIEISAARLRAACPCAPCKESRGAGRANFSGEAHLDRVALVGRYGLSCAWSDGHATGIFEWEALDEIARG